MTASNTPPGGFFLRAPELPAGRVLRAVRVDVADDGPTQFSAAVAAAPDAARVAFDRVVWNSQMVELAAIATTIGAPRINLTAQGEIQYGVRVPGAASIPQGSTVQAVLTTTGIPVIGTPLCVVKLPALGGIELFDPSAEGISADDSLRRTWVLALYEELAIAGRRATLAPASGERSGGVAPWVVAGGVIVVGIVVSAIVYGLTERAEIERRQAVELEALRNGARAQEERQREYRRTGTMPPITDAERAAQTVLDQRANAGWQRVRDAASDAIREAGKGAKTALYLAGAAAAVVILSNAKR